MPQFGARGISYTPFIGESVGDFMGVREDRRIEQEKKDMNSLAADAWMGDPQALQDLTELNPELAMEIEDQSAQRQDTETQRGVDKDERFKEDMEGVMMQIGAFETFEDAQAYGQRMTDFMQEKYPERMERQGAPAQFTQEVYDEIRIITGGAQGTPVGVPFRATDPKDRTKVVMGQQTKLKNGRTVTTYLKDSEGNLIRPAEYDAGIAYDMSYGKGAGAKEALIDLKDDEVLAALSAKAKAEIMPARKTAQATIGMITAMKTHPGLDSVVGVGWLNPAKFVPGTEAHNFQILAEQAQGKVFAQAYETLKGGGPITDFESKKAGQAIARMETSQSKGEYLAALNDFETAIRDGYDILLKQVRGEFEIDVELPTRLEGAEQYTRSHPAEPASKEEFDALPSGAYFKAPDGSIRVKR